MKIRNVVCPKCGHDDLAVNISSGDYEVDLKESALYIYAMCDKCGCEFDIVYELELDEVRVLPKSE